MSKKEAQWIYGSLIAGAVLFAFVLYLMSNYSPLNKSTPGSDLLLNQLLESSSESMLQLN